jgi:hypothetical protein
MRRGVVRLTGAAVLAGTVCSVTMAAGATAAFADTPSYELYCPGTPIGNIVLNDAKTTGTFSGSTLSNWQTSVVIPQNLVTAASAFGSTLQGSATAGVDFTGGTPATISPPTLNFNVPIPTPVAPITLALPTPAGSVGPAPAGTTTAAVNNNIKLTLLVSGAPLALTCTVHPNNTLPTGTSTAPAPAANTTPIVIATTSATAGAAPTATTAPAPATAAAASPTLPQTGPGPGLYYLAVGGLGAIALAAMLFVIGRTQRLALRVGAHGRPRRRPDES